MNKNKRGSLKCTMEALQDMHDQGVHIFEKSVIVRAEYNYIDDTIEYHFYNDVLEEVAPMCATPKYVCKIHVDVTNADNPTYEYKFVKQE